MKKSTRMGNIITAVLLVLLIVQSNSLLQASEKGAKKPSPDKVLELLKEGNQRYYTNTPNYPHQQHDRMAQAGKENQGDYAYATVITCSDSRVPVELIFDAGIMDLFVVRVAGNVCNTDEIGSIEYGLAHVNTPVLVVLGHSQCGAVTAVTHALHGEGHKLERNIPALVSGIVPAVERASKTHPELKGDTIIPSAIEENVWEAIHNLFKESPSTRNLVKEGKVKVVGAIYDVGTGKVSWLPQTRVQELLKEVEASPNVITNPYATTDFSSSTHASKKHDEDHDKTKTVKKKISQSKDNKGEYIKHQSDHNDSHH